MWIAPFETKEITLQALAIRTFIGVEAVTLLAASLRDRSTCDRGDIVRTGAAHLDQ
jgi:hypothetical protein